MYRPTSGFVPKPRRPLTLSVVQSNGFASLPRSNQHTPNDSHYLHNGLVILPVRQATTRLSDVLFALCCCCHATAGNVRDKEREGVHLIYDKLNRSGRSVGFVGLPLWKYRIGYDGVLTNFLRRRRPSFLAPVSEEDCSSGRHF